MDKKEKNLYYFEEAPVSKAVANFAVPTMLTMLVGIAYNLVDMAFVGMIKDTAALAAVALAMPVFLKVVQVLFFLVHLFLRARGS